MHRQYYAAACSVSVAVLSSLLLLVLGANLESYAAPAFATRLVAATGTDSGNCTVSPCQTVAYAVGQAVNGDIVSVASGSYTQANTLINKNLTILGAGAFSTTLQGANVDRVLSVTAIVSIRDMTISSGQTNGSGGGINTSGSLTLTNVIVQYNTSYDGSGGGGGIYNSGLLSLNDTAFTGNLAGAKGGGIDNDGSASSKLSNVTFTSNIALNSGGGIFNAGMVTVANSTLLSNSASYLGGGINNVGSLIVTDTAFTANSTGGDGGAISNSGYSTVTGAAFDSNTANAGQGGGINNYYGSGGINLTNVTLSGNSANSGGGIASGGLLTITNGTLSNNKFQFSGGGGGGSIFGNGPMELKNTIVANTPIGNNCLSYTNSIVSLGHNLDSANSCGFTSTGDLTTTNPLLGPLQNNGGATQTRALLAGSPAIDAGANAGCPAVDQRGFHRPVNGGLSLRCDIGAYEFYRFALFLPLIQR